MDYINYSQQSQCPEFDFLQWHVEPLHSQGAPFFTLRHTASAAAARTTTITAIDETDIAGSSYAFDFLVTAQMQKISAAIATTVQTPNTPPEKSMPSW